MSIPRYHFAWSVSPSTGLIYVAGGLDVDNNRLRDAEVYDVNEHKWEILPPMLQERGHRRSGVFIGEEFIVLGGGVTNRHKCRSFRSECEKLDKEGRYVAFRRKWLKKARGC